MLEKLFGFNPKTMSVRTEVFAGLTTFLTMAYVLAVNPSILSVSGMDKGALFTTTIVSSVFATLVMAMYAKLPYALAPGMGINAFFAYTVCIAMGYPWQFALTAVLIEGIIFVLLTISNFREKIVYAIPEPIRKAIGGGIGLFIATLGLQNAGIIVKDEATIVGLGDITAVTPLLTCVGVVFTAILLARKIHGALFYGILFITVLGIPLGITNMKEFVSVPPSIEPIMFQFQWEDIFSRDMAIVVFTFLFVDLFDTIGTLLGVSAKVGMVDADGKVPRLKEAFMADALGTVAGACLGTSTVTTYVESAAGIGEGGRSGLTSFVVAIFFIISLFFAPFFLAIPTAATAPVLILVGMMMMTTVSDINFSDFSDGIPAFLCLILMPLTSSIANGIIFGVLSYVLINLCSGKFKKLTLGMYILSVLFLLKFLF